MTLKNNRTENQAMSFLLESNANSSVLNQEESKLVVALFGLDKSLARVFDLIEKRGGISVILA